MCIVMKTQFIITVAKLPDKYPKRMPQREIKTPINQADLNLFPNIQRWVKIPANINQSMP